MKIVIAGTGYVGLVTGACLAEVGTDVICVDINEQKIEDLRKGILPIYEPGLQQVVDRNIQKGRLRFSTNLGDSIDGAEVLFIAVGTPPGEDGSADLSYVLQVAETAGKHMTGHMVVVTKSTVPVGTATKVKAGISAALAERASDISFDVASNPEFLKEGAAVDDFLKPDRIVIGVESEKARQILSRLYNPFILNGHPLLFMEIASAEMTKYAANAMLATKISFINDIAGLCELTGANINDVRRGVGSDPRIGGSFLYAGIGYGGSCFPKDVKALVQTAEIFGHPLRILKAVEEVNNDQKGVLVKKVRDHFAGDLSGKVFGIWGLSFKPNTDDMREAPSITIIRALLQAGAAVQAYDPVAMAEAGHLFGPSVSLADDAVSVVKNADALLLVTEWNEFRLPDWELVGKLMKQKVIFDGRNIYQGPDLVDKGFTYYGIGSR